MRKKCWVTWLFTATPSEDCASPYYDFLFTYPTQTDTNTHALSDVYYRQESENLLPLAESHDSRSPWWRVPCNRSLLFIKQMGCDPDTAFPSIINSQSCHASGKMTSFVEQNSSTGQSFDWWGSVPVQGSPALTRSPHKRFNNCLMARVLSCKIQKWTGHWVRRNEIKMQWYRVLKRLAQAWGRHSGVGPDFTCTFLPVHEI